MWTFTEDVEAFAANAWPFLLADPVANTVALTVLTGVRTGMDMPGAYFGWWTADGQVRGAVFRTPPHQLGMARMPLEAVTPLIESLHAHGRDIPAVGGPLHQVEEFVAHWPSDVAHIRSERLYELRELRVPAVPGHGRVARAEEFGLLVSWYQGFQEDAGLPPTDVVPQVERRLGLGDFVLWEHDGAPVSLAAVSVSVGGVCRIGPVYTPPSCRRRGFGAAVTAFASQSDRAERKVLFTDLSNPTSNAIYQSIGYEPVADYASVSFDG
ncbi:GNAT family N-acetyltransferase [Nonomuraea sp. NPDC050556]|uniref:GNAT family N-acetyltransferase n=1 Tax=Nonomuraea sp. NPDC050556 TaxID=3364369 RepID=UPI0037B960A1